MRFELGMRMQRAMWSNSSCLLKVNDSAWSLTRMRVVSSECGWPRGLEHHL